MEQQNKRFKTTKESTISEITASINSISESLKSIGESHGVILKANKVIVSYLQDVETAEKTAKVNKAKAANDLEL